MVILAGSVVTALAAQNVGEFRRLAAQLAEQRLNGKDTDEALQSRALSFLDAIVLAALHPTATPDVAAVNERLAALVSEDSEYGEEFRVIPLDATGGAYALLVNFGLGGPSAVRLYVRETAASRLVAGIDRFAQKDFFDEYTELVPLPPEPGSPDIVFVTVTGRTDEQRTAQFLAWRLHEGKVEKVWSSEILVWTEYEAKGSQFHITHCHEVSPSLGNPPCKRRVRERYAWQGGEWKRLELAEVPAAKP